MRWAVCDRRGAAGDGVDFGGEDGLGCAGAWCSAVGRGCGDCRACRCPATAGCDSLIVGSCDGLLLPCFVSANGRRDSRESTNMGRQELLRRTERWLSSAYLLLIGSWCF